MVIPNSQLLRLYDDIRNPSSVKLEKIPHNCQKNMTLIFWANRIMRINDLGDEYSHQNYIMLLEYYIFRNYKDIDKVFYDYLYNMISNNIFTMIDIVVIPKFVSYHKWHTSFALFIFGPTPITDKTSNEARNIGKHCFHYISRLMSYGYRHL